MVRNLLDNAPVHGHGAVRLFGEVAAADDGGRQAWLTVSDEGPGVPAELVDLVFDRCIRYGADTSANHAASPASATPRSC